MEQLLKNDGHVAREKTWIVVGDLVTSGIGQHVYSLDWTSGLLIESYEVTPGGVTVENALGHLAQDGEFILADDVDMDFLDRRSNFHSASLRSLVDYQVSLIREHRARNFDFFFQFQMPYFMFSEEDLSKIGELEVTPTGDKLLPMDGVETYGVIADLVAVLMEEMNWTTSVFLR